MSFDFSKIGALLPAILQAVSVAQDIIAAIKGGKDTGGKIDAVRNELPAVFDILKQVGGALFPGVPADQQPIAAATALDPVTVTKLQQALNAKGINVDGHAVEVDGHYGDETKRAVLSFQNANGLKADEWAGPLTLKALGIV